MNIFTHQKALLLLRWSLGITFLWFGILKLFNVSPILDIIRHALPAFLASSNPFMFSLAVLEILIGILLLAHKFVKLTAIVLILHLLVATGSVLFTQGFSPWFPVLSLAGEFVVKNLVLMAAGFVLLVEHEERGEKNDRAEHISKTNN